MDEGEELRTEDLVAMGEVNFLRMRTNPDGIWVKLNPSGSIKITSQWDDEDESPSKSRRKPKRPLTEDVESSAKITVELKDVSQKPGADEDDQCCPMVACFSKSSRGDFKRTRGQTKTERATNTNSHRFQTELDCISNFKESEGTLKFVVCN